MNERSELVAWIRGEIVGPSRTLVPATCIEFQDRQFSDPIALRSGPLGWKPTPDTVVEEVLYFQRETPHRKYGAGVLHPEGAADFEVAAEASDTVGAEADNAESEETSDQNGDEEGSQDSDSPDAGDDFEVTSPDIRHPSTLGISFCVSLSARGRVVIRLPQSKRFSWQDSASLEFPVNGRYELCKRCWIDDEGAEKDAPVWRRRSAMLSNTTIEIDRNDLLAGQIVRRNVQMPENSPIALRVEVFPRRLRGRDDVLLLTVVLRNSSQSNDRTEPREGVLYQTYFEISAEGGHLEKYPESQRPFDQLDSDEQSLLLLYRESATWAIGHGCSAGWDAEPGQPPELLYADVLPAVQTPSMTPDIKDAQGNGIKLSMRSLASLSDDGEGSTWQSLTNIGREYGEWIQRRREDARVLPDDLAAVANRNLDAAASCLDRINKGLQILRDNKSARSAFKLANLAMLLQQIATKQLGRRALNWNQAAGIVSPEGGHQSPWNIYREGSERSDLGTWRAFQIGFFLMSLDGVSSDRSGDREIVDLIWFPTGGGKTEAYLGVMAFYMFHQRLLMESGEAGPLRDGTNVLMRYTLRMLTTQQFQRAASLICAMEFLRRNFSLHGLGTVPGKRFSLGLWIGGSGSPNKIVEARNELGVFRSDRASGNPLVLTECPWCRAEIGRYDGPRPASIPQGRWKSLRIRGISDNPREGPLLLCPDGACEFGSEQPQKWLPVEVIDERIYNIPPSLVIATADKFAMIAFRPQAGALFGRTVSSGVRRQTHIPPGLIIQDELHLISGPLGTIYGVYEGVFERLCSQQAGTRWIKPKIIASTATIRGASEQIRALYAREQVQLFPSPGLLMGDSFFGTYARGDDGRLLPGRLYLGIHANDYGSILTTQVRTFSSALFRPYTFDADRRDPWWSLLVFYNSIRELSGAKTLFDSDIRSRLKFLFSRENFTPQNRRNLRIVEELTSRLSQAEIVAMMDKLSTAYTPQEGRALDVCLASNIIEVGVDIDRLSLMGVVGQPKTTAQYIQVTGRIGRRWWERPGLVLTIYNPSKSRDRSHFEQFHSYHRRLYERVEPTSATPFALSAIQRALPGALIAWSRQNSEAPVYNYASYASALGDGYELLRERCEAVQSPLDQERSIQEMERVWQELQTKWEQNPQEWEQFPPSVNGEYLMLWPGQFATRVQKQRGVVAPSSMRQVDGSAELTITQAYSAVDAETTTP